LGCSKKVLKGLHDILKERIDSLRELIQSNQGPHLTVSSLVSAIPIILDFEEIPKEIKGDDEKLLLTRFKPPHCSFVVHYAHNF
jgi:hypothetical protein